MMERQQRRVQRVLKKLKNLRSEDMKIKALTKIFHVGDMAIEDARGRIQIAITQTKEYQKLDEEHQAHALLIINEELEREGKERIGLTDIGRIAKRIEERLNVECPVNVSAKTEDTNQTSSE